MCQKMNKGIAETIIMVAETTADAVFIQDGAAGSRVSGVRRNMCLKSLFSIVAFFCLQS